MTGMLTCIAATRIGKVLLGLWLLALLLFIAVSAAGLFQGEFLGNLAFVVLPVAILLNISIVLAHHVGHGSVGIAKAAWIGIAVVVLLVTLSGFDGYGNGDIWIFLTWAMLVLAFPVGLVISLAHVVLDLGFSITIGPSYFSLVIEWLAYFGLGYAQWFVLLPWLWRKWKARRAGDARSSV
jgi:hypothetical protein